MSTFDALQRTCRFLRLSAQYAGVDTPVVHLEFKTSYEQHRFAIMLGQTVPMEWLTTLTPTEADMLFPVLNELELEGAKVVLYSTPKRIR